MNMMMINLEQIMGTLQLLLHNQSPAHDFQHILRVYKNAEMISKQERSVDLDVVLAAALLHDLVVYPKKLAPCTLEGKILQDADRLDAIGAIGLARTFSVGGSENRSLYNPLDPFCKSERPLDDTQCTLDHIKKKLMILRNSMHTKAAKKIAEERTEFMEL